MLNTAYLLKLFIYERHYIIIVDELYRWFFFKDVCLWTLLNVQYDYIVMIELAGARAQPHLVENEMF